MKKQNFFAIYTAVFLFLHPGSSIAAITQQIPAQTPPCTSSQLSFSLDAKGGYFDGMSQSGTLLVLRNIGSCACSMPARAILSFENAAHHPLPISLQTPRGMYPGPVLLPITIPAGGRAISEMRWVSSDAYGTNNCISPSFITLSLGQDTLRTKFRGYLCGPAGKNPTYRLTLFQINPK